MESLLRSLQRVAFIFLILAVVPAILLRYMQYNGGLVGFKFPFLLHTHSHVAMLGWVFTAIVTLFTRNWLPHTREIVRKLKLTTVVLIVSVVGMLVSFPLQGYAFWSILFSTLHIFAQLGFTWIFFKETEKNREISVVFARTALVLQMVSALGALSVGPVAAAGYAGQPLYFMCIYFYLHFQYNGWMLFAILALLLHFASREEAPEQDRKLQQAMRMLLGGVVFTYAGMALWCTDSLWIVIAAFLGAVLQLVALIQLYRLISPALYLWLRSLPVAVRILFTVSLISLAAKAMLQLLAVWPELNDWIAAQRGIVIAYLHLVLLGFITSFLLGTFGITARKKATPLMIAIFIFGSAFTITEIILVLSAPIPQLMSELDKAGALFILAAAQFISLLFFAFSGSDRNHTNV